MSDGDTRETGTIRASQGAPARTAVVIAIAIRTQIVDESDGRPARAGHSDLNLDSPSVNNHPTCRCRRMEGRARMF